MSNKQICQRMKLPLRGFTILELLVVVIIVAILAAVAIPKYTNAIEKQKGEACINNMWIIFASWRIYNMQGNNYNPGTFQDIDTINSTLTTSINEKYFGAPGPPKEYGFDMQYFPAPQNMYHIKTRRVAGSCMGDNIQCNYYPDGTDLGAGTIQYHWYGTWDWLPEDE